MSEQKVHLRQQRITREEDQAKTFWIVIQLRIKHGN